jgi:hypothetical protein
MQTGSSYGFQALTARLRQAGAMVLHCQLTRNPGLACSRMVRRIHFRFLEYTAVLSLRSYFCEA